MRQTYKDLQDSLIPSSVGACVDDPRLLKLTNEALERLMYEGHFHTTVQRIRFCATDGCITYPPQVASLERIAICGQPIPLRTIWFEWMDGGWGLRGQQASSTDSDSCCGFGCGPNEAIFRGYFPTFADINPINQNKKVNLVCDLSSDVGKEVLVLGYDENNIWIRTEQDGVIADGEVILLAQGAGTTSTNFFSCITDIQFNEERDSVVWVYEYNTTASTRRMIGTYQAFETRPNYARYFFPAIVSSPNSDDSGCAQTLVEAIAKLNFWPVKVPNDYLCVPCLPALKEMMMAINSAQNEPDGVKKQQIMAAGLVAALHILNMQLEHFTGSGNRIAMTVINGEYISVVPALL